MLNLPQLWPQPLRPPTHPPPLLLPLPLWPLPCQVSAHGTGAAIPPVDEQVVALKLVAPALGTIELSQVRRVLLWGVGIICLKVAEGCIAVKAGHPCSNGNRELSHMRTAAGRLRSGGLEAWRGCARHFNPIASTC